MNINFECKDSKTGHIYKESILTKDLYKFVNNHNNKNMIYLFKGVC
jgi:hypothetical protein